MDPLSEVLALLKPRTHVAPGLDAGGDWALQFPAHEGIKFDAIVRGSCWLLVEGEEACFLEQGDCFLLTSGRPFVLASDLALRPSDARAIFPNGCSGVARYLGGGDFFLVGGRFAFTSAYADVLFGSLPAVLPVRASSEEASVLRWALDLFAREIHEGKPGGLLSAEHLAHLMLIQVLRIYLSSRQSAGIGWLFALGDPRLSAAITAMHLDLARQWTLEDLAKTAGMSRSSFAEKFKTVVGNSPMEYLARWRMQVAGDRLRNTESNIATIAYAVGYESEAAFSTAFKRAMGHAPKYHRQSLPELDTEVVSVPSGILDGVKI
jgi:AraC-like DNA-binding protein